MLFRHLLVQIGGANIASPPTSPSLPTHSRSRSVNLDLGTRSVFWRSALEWWPCHPASKATAPATLRFVLRPCRKRTILRRCADTASPSTMTTSITTTSSLSLRKTAGAGVARSGGQAKLVVYRIAVGLLGLILVALGFVSGPILGRAAFH